MGKNKNTFKREDAKKAKNTKEFLTTENTEGTEGDM
jgi:hypothetical protein